MIRYFGSHALETISSGLLKVAVPTSFNDPFEYVFSVQTYGHKSDWLRELLDTRMRILCFSNSDHLEEQGDVLMWSHYANGHKGVRITFERSFFEEASTVLEEIQYQEQFPIPPWWADHTRDIATMEAFQSLSSVLFGKAKFWNYEEEIRAFFEIDRCIRSNGMDFVRFPPSAIKRIDFGISTDETLKKKIQKQCRSKEYRHIAIFQCNRRSDSFSIEYTKK